MPANNTSPAPWRVRRTTQPNGGRSVAIVSEQTGGVVALVKSANGRKEGNADLLAAAPDLLAAQKETLAQLEQLMKGEACDHSVGICYCDTFRAMDAARAAITKATGKE